MFVVVCTCIYVAYNVSTLPILYGLTHMLHLQILQRRGIELLLIRRGMSSRGVGNQPLPFIPVWKILYFGHGSRTIKVDYDNSKVDGEIGKVEPLTPRI